MKKQDSSKNLTLEKFGQPCRTANGFPVVLFDDAYDSECSIQMSSAIGDYEGSFENPGTSFVWLGVDDPDPKIMRKDAIRLGIKTDEDSGWVPYPLPDEVLVKTQMHLNREQVQGLIGRLQEWLDTGKFSEE